MPKSSDNHRTSTDDVLMEEYKALIPQIIHWDSHFWNKSKFFLAIESAFLAGALLPLREYAEKRTSPPTSILALLLVVALFNLYLTYVWFRTNRRNREFLDSRFARARVIERRKRMRTFTEDADLPREHSSARHEIHLPTGFAIAWTAVVAFAALMTWI